ncbi:MAG: cysteine synthase family protein [Candidatus Bathyarchaeota archaeon]|nr:MAG: cysteine synthase family protein [Candidatus Bathyarchaeota archaeon]
MIEVGNTPLLKVDEIFAKLECTNPLGSIKDRMVKYIIEQSERLGLLRPGMTIVEASSGNTGIALSYFAREKGYPVIIVMPKNMTSERKRILKKLGSELVLCSEGNFLEAISIRDKLAKNEGYFSSNQFSNPLNAKCHYETTAQEILDQIRPHSGNIAAFVSGVGTGGTLIGCGKRLKEAFTDMKIVAVEPSESPVMSGGEPGLHGIAGIGDGFIPDIISNGMDGFNELIDDVMCVSTIEARRAAKYLAEEKAMCVGMSAGANFLAAKKASKKYGTTVTIFPDGFLNYRSQGLTRVGRDPCPNRKRCNCVVKQMYLHENPGFDCDCGWLHSQ